MLVNCGTSKSWRINTCNHVFYMRHGYQQNQTPWDNLSTNSVAPNGARDPNRGCVDSEMAADPSMYLSDWHITWVISPNNVLLTWTTDHSQSISDDKWNILEMARNFNWNALCKTHELCYTLFEVLEDEPHDEIDFQEGEAGNERKLCPKHL